MKNWKKSNRPQAGMVNWLVNTPLRIKKTGKCGNFIYHHQDSVGGRLPFYHPFHLGLLVLSQAFTAAYSPDSQVAMKTAAFWSKTMLDQFFIDLLLECPEQVLSLSNTNPERPWALLTGKRSQTNPLNLQRIPIGHCQTDCTADAGKFRFRDISQEFQRQMHVLSTSPVDSRQARCKFIFE